MPGTRCSECGGPMAITRRSERPEEDLPTKATVDDDEVPDDTDIELAAQDVDATEHVAVKAATLVCGACGTVMAVPER